MNFKLLFLALLLPACSSVNNLSGAKTLADAEHQIFAGVSYGQLRRHRDPEDDAIPALDLGLRYGMTDRDEVMLKATSNFASYAADYKRALLSGPFFYLSTGVGFGFYKDNFLREDNPITGTDLSIPIYGECFVTEQTSLLLGARLVRSVVSNEGRSDFGTIVLTTGIRTGKESGLHLELGHGRANKKSVPDLWQLSAGFYF